VYGWTTVSNIRISPIAAYRTATGRLNVSILKLYGRGNRKTLRPFAGNADILQNMQAKRRP